mgnify:CR=1 FL=1
MDDLSSKQNEFGNQIDKMNLVSDMLGNVLNSLPQSDWPVSFVPSGFPSVDQLTNGLETSSLITVIGRPGMGKTSLALDLALFAGMHGRKVYYFSYETSKEEILFRLLSKLSFVPASYIRLLSQSDDDAEWQRLITAAETLYNTKIYIDDNPANTVEDIREICSQIDNIGLICVDYFQLVGSRACYANAKDESEQFRTILEKNINFDKLLRIHAGNKKLLHYIMDQMVALCADTGAKIHLSSGRTVDTETVKNRIIQINYDDIETLLQNLPDKSECNIKNPQGYIRTCLFNIIERRDAICSTSQIKGKNGNYTREYDFEELDRIAFGG